MQTNTVPRVTPLRGPESEPIRIPPYNTDAEQALLGAILINNSAYARVSEFLAPEHFGYAVHGRIFAAIAKLIERGQIANPVTLKNLFDQDGALTEMGGAQYLAQLVSSAVTIINTEDYDSNYFALGHPSDPNYIRPLGGSDFGLDYNPAGNVIDANSLMQEMDQANISWAGYAQSMPTAGYLVSSGDYSVDELPFAQFNYVFDNTPAYLQDHLLPLTQLSTDLQDPSKFPEFTWIAANEANNGEGPINSLQGIGQFIYSQFTDHQYNVAAADQFVQQEVSAIENSQTWTDSGEKDAIIITFDEDNNNLSLGFGNEGNNVPMIVIPNEDAVANGGMESGPFTTDAYSNEYSLMATIEDALRTTPGTLAPLTDNDMYAPPMNAFWK